MSAQTVEALRHALWEAAQSLQYIAGQAGRHELIADMVQIRGYANSRAICATKAIAAAEAQPESLPAAEPVAWRDLVLKCITDPARAAQILSIPSDATADEARAILAAPTLPVAAVPAPPFITGERVQFLDWIPTQLDPCIGHVESGMQRAWAWAGWKRRAELAVTPPPAAPAVPQPLTDEQIAAAFGWSPGSGPLHSERSAARAIERAHGIGAAPTTNGTAPQGEQA